MSVWSDSRLSGEAMSFQPAASDAVRNDYRSGAQQIKTVLQEVFSLMAHQFGMIRAVRFHPCEQGRIHKIATPIQCFWCRCWKGWLDSHHQRLLDGAHLAEQTSLDAPAEFSDTP
jgi:hypothetical protein